MGSVQTETECLDFQPSDKQIEIVKMVRLGMSYQEIAEALFVSSRTVRREIKRLKGEVGVTTLPALLADVTRRGW
ncbi:helix-turn-helix transcriptional regulator [Kitasatospora sp. NPDC098663]|uniref:helix-turn-helix transcriptional regulator n=1 Tax=Kitasatospora sp. NPDC098663 TaxID=3364096 RepID=UPI00381E7282